jgi:hypothetical protein
MNPEVKAPPAFCSSACRADARRADARQAMTILRMLSIFAAVTCVGSELSCIWSYIRGKRSALSAWPEGACHAAAQAPPKAFGADTFCASAGTATVDAKGVFAFTGVPPSAALEEYRRVNGVARLFCTFVPPGPPAVSRFVSSPERAGKRQPSQRRGGVR